MGRGRAKAKQTKVARELKYSSRGTDLDALRAELAGAQQRPGEAADGDGADDDEDPYADYDDGSDGGPDGGSDGDPDEDDDLED